MRLIESKRLYVRYLDMNDLEDYYRLNGDEELMRYIRAPKTREETETFLQQTIDAYSYDKIDLRLGLYAIDTDEFVGSFALIPLVGTDQTQIGYALLKEHWGKGYASEIVEAGKTYAFQSLKLNSLAAVTEAGNVASQKVLLKNGFNFLKEYLEKEKLLYQYISLPGRGE